MQYHGTTFEDDADVFNFLTVTFDPYASSSSGFFEVQMPSSYNSVNPENDAMSPLLATPVAPPPAHDTTRIESPGFNTYEFAGVIETPAAPEMKDLDSFTEGTGAGSFADFVDEDDVNELAMGNLVSHPEPYTPNPLIMAWLEDVRITHQFSDPSAESNAPSVGFTDLPEDSAHMEALEATEALLEDFVIDTEAERLWDVNGDDNDEGDDWDVNVNVDKSVGPRIPSPSILVPPMSAPLTAMTPRAMKRARSRSPASQSSRRVRSKSLSSIHGLPRDRTALPPWRSNLPFKDMT